MKPLIGLSASLDGVTVKIQRENIRAIEISGGIPVIIPYYEQEESILTLVDSLDGLLLTGGGDIDPHLFGEEPIPSLDSITPDRDWLESILIKRFMQDKKPILGICRGCQILNVVAGGGMYQDIYSQYTADLLQHTQQAPRDHASHWVTIEKGTLLSQIVGEEKVRVNSFHHQAVHPLAPDFILSAKSADGIIEAFESTLHPFVVGVQWHPEDLFASRLEAKRLFAAFVEKCLERKRRGQTKEKGAS